MEAVGSLEKDYVLVEHEFEYTAKDGRVISIKPHERYILLKRTNEHWWQVCQDTKTKPFYIPAKYVKVLSSSGQSSNGIEVLQEPSVDLMEQVPRTRYSYAFLPADPQPSAGGPSLAAGARSNVQTINATSTLPAGQVQRFSSGFSHSLMDLSVVSEKVITGTVQITSLDRTDSDRTLGPLRTFHNSRKILDPQKRISFMCPLDLQPTIRPTQSLNDLQVIGSESPGNRQPESRSIAEIQQPEGRSVPEIRQPVGSSIAEIQQPEGRSIAEIRQPESRSVPEIRQPESRSIPEIRQPEGSSIAEIRQPERSNIPEIRQPEGSSIAEIRQPERSNIPEIRQPEGSSIAEIQQPEGRSVPEIRQPGSRSVPEIRQPGSRSVPEIRQPERSNVPEIRLHMESLSIQQSFVAGSERASSTEKAVKEEEDPVPIYANLEELRKDGVRQRSSSQHRSSTSTIEDWETHVDKGSGHQFYYNCITGETTWDCPFDQAEDQLHSPFSPTCLSPLPGDTEWEKHFDETSGQCYFYNSVTGETSWDPPPDNELHLLGMKPMFSPYGSVNRRPPTPEADYPDYPREDTEDYPEKDYDGFYVPPPPHKAPFDEHISSWSCQVKDGQKLYTNTYNGDTWLQSQDQYGKTFFYTPDGSLSLWSLPQLGPPEFQKGGSDPDQNSNIITSWQSSITPFSLQKQTETKGLEKAGVLHKAKIAENGKRLRKNWSASWTVLEGGILTFFKDAKNLSSSSLKQSLLTTPEYTLKLQGASLRWATKEKSSKKHVLELKTCDGSEYLIHHDSETITSDWFTSISKSIGKNARVSSENTSENEIESLQEFGSTEKLGIKDEKKTPGQNNNSDSDRNVRAKLKKFLQRRPTLQSLRDKGYIRDQVFGCHLHELCEREKRNVPEFVTRSIEVVDKRGLDIDGLYRVSGNLAIIQKLRYKVDHDENFNLDDGRWEDIHVITGALKLFFRELPEPLFPYSHFDGFIEAIKLSDQNQKIRRLKELVLSLPSPNLETMRLLFRHLCSVIEHKESNRMSVQSVAIVFGPTLLKPQVEAGNIAMYMVFQNQIVEQVLNQYKYIFTSS